MASQLLINVIRVPAGSGDLALGDSVTLPHGLRSNDRDVRPTLIQPDRGTGIVVTTVTDTEVTFTNNGVDGFAYFRLERGLSNEVDAETLEPSYWQGTTSGGGGNINAVFASAPLNSSAPAGPTTTLSLNNSGVVAGTYGVVAGPTESVMPVFTVDAKGLVTSASSGAIRINGEAAKTYVDQQDAATLAAAEAYAQTLAFGIASKNPAHVATTVALPSYTVDGTFTILTATANGPFPLIDGETVVLNERVLVKNEAGADEPNNGIYMLTQVGDGSNPWILMRTADANTPQELCGALVSVETGPTNGGTLWLFGANALTFTLGTTPVIFEPISVPNATTASPGAVQLTGGLGGLGSVYNSPKLDVDPANVTSGVLPTVRGGTNVSAAGAAGNVLTSDGTDWYSAAPAPVITSVDIARTYYVTMAGGVAPAADGSITNPFNNVDDAIAQAAADFPLGEGASIIVAPGTYAGFTLNRKNTFIQGYGARPEDRVLSIITGSVTIDLGASGGSVYNDQVGISGCYVTSGSGAAVSVIGGAQFSVSITNCYLYAGDATSTALIENANGNARISVTDSFLDRANTVSTGGVFSGNGLLRFSDVQAYTRGIGAYAAFTFSGNGVGFFDRLLLGHAGTGAAFSVGTSVNPATAPWFSGVAAVLTLAGSSITSSGTGIAVAALTLPAPTFPVAFLAENFFSVASTAISVTGVQVYIAYSNTFSPTSNTSITGGTLVAAQEVHSTLRLPTLASASRPLKADANRIVVSDQIDLSSSNDVKNTLGVGFGGTGQTTFTANSLLVGNGGSALSSLGPTASRLAGWDSGSTASTITIGSGLSLTGTTLTATGSGGTVTSVTASAPLASSGGATPDISVTPGSVGQFLVTAAGPTVQFANPSAGGILTGTYPDPSGLRGNTSGSIIPIAPDTGATEVIFRNNGISGSGAGTTLKLAAGLNSGSGTAGSAFLLGGQAASGIGGNAVVQAGGSTSGAGGDVYILGGAPAASGQTPGNLYIQAGQNSGDGSRGTVQFAASGYTFLYGSVVIRGNTYPTSVVAAGDLIYATGAATLGSLTVGANGTVLKSNGTAPSWGTLTASDLPANVIPYDVGGSAATVPASEDFWLFLFNRVATLAETAATYKFYAITAASTTARLLTLDYVDPITPANSKTLGTVDFTVGATNPNFVPDAGFTSPLTTVVGGYLKLTSDGGSDPALANVMFTFKATTNAV